MITLNQTSGTNNECIWVLKINTPTPIYLSTRDLVLDSTFDGKALNYDNPITDISYGSSVASGGGTGEVTSFSFSISRYINNSSLADFFNEFYPATSGVYLTSQIVQLGICWVGAAADTDITWLMTGRIVDYQYEQRKLNITVFQESEITNKEVPYYSVQKDFDNGISYFTKAPDESYGKTIPIVYGNLSTTDNWGASLCVPCIYVDQTTLSVICASHYVLVAPSVMLSYINEIKSYLEMTSSQDASSNTYAGCLFSLQTSGAQVYGKLFIKLGIPNSFVSTAQNVLDAPNTSNYLELDDTDRLDLSPIGIVHNSKIAALSTTDADIGFHYLASSDGGGNRNIKFTRYNIAVNEETNTNPIFTVGIIIADNVMHFGTSTEAKNNANIPWTIEEVCSQRYRVQNVDPDSGDLVRIYYGYIVLDNIKLQNVISEYKIATMPSRVHSGDLGNDYVIR